MNKCSKTNIVLYTHVTMMDIIYYFIFIFERYLQSFLRIISSIDYEYL